MSSTQPSQFLKENITAQDLLRLASECKGSASPDNALIAIQSALEIEITDTVSEGYAHLCLELGQPTLGLRFLDRLSSPSGREALLLRAACHATQSNWQQAIQAQLLALDFSFQNKDVECCENLRLVIFYREAGQLSDSEQMGLMHSLEGSASSQCGFIAARDALTQCRYAEAAGFASFVLAQLPDDLHAAEILGLALQKLDRPAALLNAVASYTKVRNSFAATILDWIKVLEQNGQCDKFCLLLRAALKLEWTNHYSREFQNEAKRLHVQSQTAPCIYDSSCTHLLIDGVAQSDGQDWQSLYMSFFKDCISLEELADLSDELILVLAGVEDASRYRDVLACIDALTPGHAAAVTWGGTIVLRMRDLRDILAAFPNVTVEAACVLPVLVRSARLAWVDPAEIAPIFEPGSIGSIWHWFDESRPYPMSGLRQAGIEITRQDFSLFPTDSDSLRCLRRAIWLEAPAVILVDDDVRSFAEAAVIGLRVAVVSKSECQDKDSPALLRMIGAKLDPVAIALGSGIGNIILGTPMVRRLAQALGRPIDVILNADYPECDVIFHNVPWVNEVHVNIQDVFQKTFELVLVAHCFFKPRMRFSSSLTIWACDHGSANKIKLGHESAVNLSLLSDRLSLPFSEADIRGQFISTFQHQPSGRRRIGLHAGSKTGRWLVKRWPYFEALAERLVRCGFEVICVGGQDEVIPGVVNLTGLPLIDTFEVISSCDAFIANDSGLMHAADALGVPLLAIFGPTSIVKNGPLSPGARIVQLDRDCAPCQFEPKRFDTCNCIADITISQVEREFNELWLSVNTASVQTGASAVPVFPGDANLSLTDFDEERSRAIHLFDNLPELLSLSASEVSSLFSRAPQLGLAHQVVQIPAEVRSGLIQRYPSVILSYIEAATFVLNSKELEELIGYCLSDTIAARSPKALRAVLSFLLIYLGREAAACGISKLESVFPHLVAGLPFVRQIAASALGAQNELIRDLSLAKSLLLTLRAGNRSGFIAAVNAWLSSWRGAHNLVLLLQADTDALASLRLTPMDIWHEERSDLLDVLLFPDCLDIPPENLQAAVMWSAARKDLDPINHFLNARLGDLQPVKLSGTDLRSILGSVLDCPVIPARRSLGRVTVIMAAHAPDPVLLELAIRSNLRQSYEDIEILLIDDCSPVPVEQLLCEELFHHPRLRLHRLSHHSGPYVCRNVGISLSAGPWIAFHDADDVSHPQRIEYQIGALAEDPLMRVCYVGHVRFDAQGRIQPAWDASIIGDGPVTSICRREVFEGIGTFSPVQSRGDLEMRARITLAYGASTVLKLNIPLLYCAGGMSLSSRAIANLLGPIRLFRRAFERRLVCAPASSLGGPKKLGPLPIPLELLGASTRISWPLNSTGSKSSLVSQRLEQILLNRIIR